MRGKKAVNRDPPLMLDSGNKDIKAVINMFKNLKEKYAKEEVVLNENKISLDAGLFFWLLFFFFQSSYQNVNCLMKAFFLFPTFIPTPKPQLIPPNPHSCCFSWTHFCRIIVCHNLIKNAVISQVHWPSIYFIQTSLNI